jgi:DNA-binding response OmpR family regulator
MSASKVLVVDDDRESRNLLREVLEENGYQVAAVQDGKAALEELSVDGATHIVIADLRMPGQSGLDLLRELRGMDSRYAVVLMSSYFSDAARRTARELGVDGLLEKPFRLAELLQMVSELTTKSPLEVSNEPAFEAPAKNPLRGA